MKIEAINYAETTHLPMKLVVLDDFKAQLGVPHNIGEKVVKKLLTNKQFVQGVNMLSTMTNNKFQVVLTSYAKEGERMYYGIITLKAYMLTSSLKLMPYSEVRVYYIHTKGNPKVTGIEVFNYHGELAIKNSNNQILLASYLLLEGAIKSILQTLNTNSNNTLETLVSAVPVLSSSLPGLKIGFRYTEKEKSFIVGFPDQIVKEKTSVKITHSAGIGLLSRTSIVLPITQNKMLISITRRASKLMNDFMKKKKDTLITLTLPLDPTLSKHLLEKIIPPLIKQQTKTLNKTQHPTNEIEVITTIKPEVLQEEEATQLIRIIGSQSLEVAVHKPIPGLQSKNTIIIPSLRHSIIITQTQGYTSIYLYIYNRHTHLVRYYTELHKNPILIELPTLKHLVYQYSTLSKLTSDNGVFLAILTTISHHSKVLSGFDNIWVIGGENNGLGLFTISSLMSKTMKRFEVTNILLNSGDIRELIRTAQQVFHKAPITTKTKNLEKINIKQVPTPSPIPFSQHQQQTTGIDKKQKNQKPTPLSFDELGGNEEATSGDEEPEEEFIPVQDEQSKNTPQARATQPVVRDTILLNDARRIVFTTLVQNVQKLHLPQKEKELVLSQLIEDYESINKSRKKAKPVYVELEIPGRLYYDALLDVKEDQVPVWVLKTFIGTVLRGVNTYFRLPEFRPIIVKVSNIFKYTDKLYQMSTIDVGIQSNRKYLPLITLAIGNLVDKPEIKIEVQKHQILNKLNKRQTNFLTSVIDYISNLIIVEPITQFYKKNGFDPQHVVTLTMNALRNYHEVVGTLPTNTQIYFRPGYENAQSDTPHIMIVTESEKVKQTLKSIILSLIFEEKYRGRKKK